MSFKYKIGFLAGIFTMGTVKAITLNIPSYPAESIIPDDYTYNSGGNCSGANVSPQLVWSDVPEGTQSLAIVFVDLNFNWLHWMLYNIPPSFLKTTQIMSALMANQALGSMVMVVHVRLLLILEIMCLRFMH